MKAFITLFTTLAMFCALPTTSFAKERPKSKREIKEEAEKKEKEAKDKEDAAKENLYTVVIKPNMGDATDADLAKIKGILSVSANFKTKEITLEDKQLVVTLSIKAGRISKADVTRLLKDSKDRPYTITRFEEVKPEKEKKDKPGDKKDDPKKEDPKKDMPKPGTPPAPPAPVPPAAPGTPPPAGTPPATPPSKTPPPAK